MSESMYLLMFFGMIALFFGFLMLISKRTPLGIFKDVLQFIQKSVDDAAKRCPVCKIGGEKIEMKRSELAYSWYAPPTRHSSGGMQYSYRYRCPKCGHRKLYQESNKY